jgi:hypothetical protein
MKTENPRDCYFGFWWCDCTPMITVVPQAYWEAEGRPDYDSHMSFKGLLARHGLLEDNYNDWSAANLTKTEAIAIFEELGFQRNLELEAWLKDSCACSRCHPAACSDS